MFLGLLVSFCSGYGLGSFGQGMNLCFLIYKMGKEGLLLSA